MVFYTLVRSKMLKVMASLLLVALGGMILAPHVALAAQTLQVNAGSAIALRVTEAISAEKYNIGDKVNLVVVSDVKVGGVTVIKAGAPAVAEVTTAIQRGIVGSAAKIGITVQSVQAVDGSTIALSGTRLVEGKSKMAQSVIIGVVLCCFAFFIKGGDAIIPVESQINAIVLANATVVVP